MHLLPEEMAKIERMERGKLRQMGKRPHHNHQDVTRRLQYGPIRTQRTSAVRTGGNRQLCSFHETGRSVCGRNHPADSPGTGKTLSEKKEIRETNQEKVKKTIKRPGNKIRLSPGNYLDAFDLVYAPHHIDYGLSPVQNLETQPFIICDESLEFLFT